MPLQRVCVTLGFADIYIFLCPGESNSAWAALRLVPSHSTCMHATKPLAVTASAWWLVAPVWIFVSSESPQTPSLEQRSPPRRPHSRQRPLPQGRAGCARVHAFLGRTRGACVPRAFLMLKGLARLLVRANASQHLSWVYRVQQVAGGPKPSTALT